jgi:polyhydroxybutyrate depolymerase
MSSKRKRILLIVVVVALLPLLAVAVGTYWATGPALRCQLPTDGSAGEGWSARTLVSGGIERCYYLYAPPGLDPVQPAPVVLSFHGFLSNPDSHALITGWHALAREEGFLVVYPQGTQFPQRWNAGSTWGDSDVDDVQFYRELLDHLSTLTAVDRSRVYVNGFSNGGGMTVRIGCEAAELVAAIGSVAGAVVEMEDCDPSRPLPAMAFHGTADPIVPYEGGEMKGWLLRWAAGVTDAPTYFVGAEDWVALWAEGNGCNPVPETIPQQGDVYGLHYTGCAQSAGGAPAADVVFYTIADGGHTWPGGIPIPGVGKTTNDIDATREMWQFFQAYRLDIQ